MNDLLYDALMLGRNKDVAREEFLSARGKKAPVLCNTKETNLYFSDILEDTTGIIHFQLENEGYAEMEVCCGDDFIVFDRKVISTDDFQNGAFDFTFTVKAANLHNGKNFGRIIFRNPVMNISVDIIVHNKIRVSFGGGNFKTVFARICRDYINLRTGKIFRGEWQDTTEKLLKNIGGGDAEELFLILYRVSVLLAMERREEAGNLIEFVSGQLQKLGESHWDLLCYFLYIGSMYEMNDERTAEVTEKIRQIYDSHPSWMILWILFYMDSDFAENPGMMLDAMEEEFILRKCSSPAMYFEAAECLKKDPELLDELTDFNVQVMNFVAKEDFLSVSIAMKFAELVWNCPEEQLRGMSLDVLIRIMKASYDIFSGGLLLKTLCRLLVCADRKDKAFHDYFKRAIAGFLETEGIYNYFLYTADHEEFMLLPEIVLQFFYAREMLLGEHRAYFYACIIEYKNACREYYKKYSGNIIRYAAESINRGAAGSSYGVIYRELINEDLLPRELYGRMVEILHTREIKIDNSLIAGVLAFHKELGEYQESYLEKGSAMVRIFPPEAEILFKDTTGNLYYNIEYKSREFMNRAEFIDLCMKYSEINRYMLIGDNLPLLRVYKDPVEILEYMFGQMGSGMLRASYEQELLVEMIVYFSKNAKNDAVYDRLLYFTKFDLDANTRGKLIEVMIERKLFKEAFEEIEKYGFAAVEPAKLTILAHVVAELTDYEENEIMTALCRESFMKGDFDPIVFMYLRRNFNGDMETLQKMRTAALAYKMPDITIEERILKKTIEAGLPAEDGANAFMAYYEAGDDDVLKEDYMIMACDRYLYEKEKGAGFIFEYVEKELVEGKQFPDKTAVAFLLYMRKKDFIENRTVRVIENLLNDLARRSIMLEEFKDYGRHFELPAALCNCYTASVFKKSAPKSIQVTMPGLLEGAPVIDFELKQRGGKVHSNEPMKEIFEGCYVKYFTLFFGESVSFKIDGGPETVVTYHDLNIVHDGSRFALMDNMIKLIHSGDEEALEKAAKEYLIRDMLVDKLF
ncbi:MAG: DUF5717 family protein [Lachnospiraceae bacterium]